MILVGIQPIIALGRNDSIDPFFFAAITCLYQALLFLPITFLNRKKLKSQLKKHPTIYHVNYSLLYGWKKKKNIYFLLYIGISFSISQILFYLALDMAGAINGALSQKITILFGLLFGYLINHEKVSFKQILFSFILLFGLVIAITEGKFNLLDLNIGVILMTITTMLWMLAHSLTKPILDYNQISSSQLVLTRNLLNGLIIFSIYFIFFPLENIKLFFSPENQLAFFLMAITYGLDLICWYTTLKYLEVSKATTIMAPTPVVTAILSTIIIGEIFTVYHLIGTIIMVISIVIIVKEKKKN